MSKTSGKLEYSRKTAHKNMIYRMDRKKYDTIIPSKKWPKSGKRYEKWRRTR